MKHSWVKTDSVFYFIETLDQRYCIDAESWDEAIEILKNSTYYKKWDIIYHCSLYDMSVFTKKRPTSFIFID